MRVTNVVIAGLGGQGVIKASDILAGAALRAGLDVKKSELHGMSQRGGSVTSDVRFGDRVISPMVPRGEADFLVALDLTQVEVNRPLLRPGGMVLSPGIVPEGRLRNKRSLNVAMLGALSRFVGLPPETILAVARAALPQRLHAINERAFHLGREMAGREMAGREMATPGQGTPGQGTPGQGTPGQGTPGQGTPGQGPITPGADHQEEGR